MAAKGKEKSLKTTSPSATRQTPQGEGGDKFAVEPAPLVSRDEDLALWEGDFRKLTAMVKTMAAKMRDTPGSTLKQEIEDAAELAKRSSVTGTFTLSNIEPILTKGKKFKSGRKKGTLKATNSYLLSLITRFPDLNGKAMFRIACDEAESGLSPFQFDHADGGLLLDGDVEIGLEKFIDRLSKAKNRHMR